jgi:hypothetical protein
MVCAESKPDKQDPREKRWHNQIKILNLHLSTSTFDVTIMATIAATTPETWHPPNRLDPGSGMERFRSCSTSKDKVTF